MSDSREDVSTSSSAIAIVGIGCRFPGGVTDAASFWGLLVGEADTVTEVPEVRFSLDAVYDPRPQTPGRISTRYGAFLDGIEQFDADFFGMTPLEAKNVDPQQRLLLEVAWEALEDAGMSLDRIPRPRTGVYVGMMASDYEDRMQANVTSLNGFALNGGGRYGASGRLSFCLGLNGPSLTVDTACSSSLLAVHLASHSLRRRECDLAFAGGAHVILQPHVSISLSQANILARDGHCKFGDASADGFVRGEGAGLVLLKRLEDAVADGDRVHAVLRGSGVNNDGSSTRTMGKPSRQKQEEPVKTRISTGNRRTAAPGQSYPTRRFISAMSCSQRSTRGRRSLAVRSTDVISRTVPARSAMALDVRISESTMRRERELPGASGRVRG